MSKIQEIATVDQLLANLSSSEIWEDYRGFSSRIRTSQGGDSEIRLEAGHEKPILKVRPILHPSRRLLKDDPGLGVVVCPHIAEALATDLRKAGIPHADLNGRFFVQTHTFLIDRRPGEIRFQSPRKGADPFAPKGTRVVRALLSRRDRSWTQEELSRQTKVSRTIVSQVLGQLAEDELVHPIGTRQRGKPAHYQVANFDRLLDDWKTKDDWQARTAVHQFSVLSNDANQIARKVLDSLGQEAVAFTQWFAAWLRKPYTTPPVVSAYLKHPRLLDVLKARPVSTGGNLWLILPTDEGVWQEHQESQGFPLASDVQIYLDLLQTGQRGPEAAEELRQWEGFAR